jgi:hypothetical protein
MSGAALVQFSAANLTKLLPIGRQAFDRSLAEQADVYSHEPPLHHMLCVAAIKSPGAKTAEDCRPYLGLFHAGVIVVADDRDCAGILELAGMPGMMVETVQRGTCTLFLSGTLDQWANALLRGCQPEVPREVRQAYNDIYTEFKNASLAGIFSVQVKAGRDSQTFYLDYKP